MADDWIHGTALVFANYIVADPRKAVSFFVDTIREAHATGCPMEEFRKSLESAVAKQLKAENERLRAANERLKAEAVDRDIRLEVWEHAAEASAALHPKGAG